MTDLTVFTDLLGLRVYKTHCLDLESPLWIPSRKAGYFNSNLPFLTKTWTIVEDPRRVYKAQLFQGALVPKHIPFST